MKYKQDNVAAKMLNKNLLMYYQFLRLQKSNSDVSGTTPKLLG